MSLLMIKSYLLPHVLEHYIKLTYYKTERLDFNISHNIIEFVNNYPLIEFNKIERKILFDFKLDSLQLIINAISNENDSAIINWTIKNRT